MRSPRARGLQQRACAGQQVLRPEAGDRLHVVAVLALGELQALGGVVVPVRARQQQRQRGHAVHALQPLVVGTVERDADLVGQPLPGLEMGVRGIGQHAVQVEDHGRAAHREHRRAPGPRAAERMQRGAARGQHEDVTRVRQLQSLALLQPVGHAVHAHRHRQGAAAPAQRERVSGPAGRQHGGERRHAVADAQAAEAHHQALPAAGHRRHVHAMAGVAVQVVQVHPQAVEEIAQRPLRLAHRCGHDAVHRRGQGGVVRGQRLVVVEAALRAQRRHVPVAQRQRHDHVGLLADLVPVEGERVVVQQQRAVAVLLGGEGPVRPAQERVVLGIDAQIGILAEIHRIRGATPQRDLFLVQPQPFGQRRMRLRTDLAQQCPGLGGAAQVPACHPVGVVVVVDQRRVLVRAGHLVQTERAAAARVEAADLRPDARGLAQHLRAGLGEEVQVAGRIHVQADGVRHRRVDVVRRRPAGVVRRAFVAGDGAPGVQRAVRVVHLPRMGARGLQRVVAVAQHRQRHVRRDEHHRRQHEHLGVPEAVPLVALAGQALGRRPVHAAASGGLMDMEQVEAQRLLDVRVARHRQAGAVPERPQGAFLARREPVEAGLGRAPQRSRDSGFQHRVRGAGGVRHQLLQHHADAGLQHRLERLRGPARPGRGAGWPQTLAEPVALRAAHPPAAVVGGLGQPCVLDIRTAAHVAQAPSGARTDARVVALCRRALPGAQARDQPQGPAVGLRRDRVADGQHIGPHVGRHILGGRRHHPLGADGQHLALGRAQAQQAREAAGAQVQAALGVQGLACVRVQAAVPEPDLDAGAVRHRDTGVAGACEARQALVVVDRLAHVGRGEKGAGRGGERFLGLAAHAQRAVRQCEQGPFQRGASRIDPHRPQPPGVAGGCLFPVSRCAQIPHPACLRPVSPVRPARTGAR